MKLPKQLYIAFIIYLILIILLLLHYEHTHKPKIEPVPILTQEVAQVIAEDIKEVTEVKKKYLGTYKIYAYCPCVKCCGKDNGITASGTIATQGRTVASKLPFGTKIEIEGIGERISEDVGGGIGDGVIDLFMDSHTEAENFGVRKLKVWIIN